MRPERITVLTGAGISKESGLATFRDSGGLWEGYDINEVASPEGWRKDPVKVLEFYNKRRAQAAEAEPNSAHYALVELENHFDVTVLTQNVDDLHEKAGSSNVVHLHGQLSKARSEFDESLVIDIGDKPIKLGDKADDGAQLRPHVVWFGEMVPMIEKAANIFQETDILIVIGTSLVVYPAAGLTEYAKPQAQKFIIDPSLPELYDYSGWEHIREKAGTGTPVLVEKLIKRQRTND